MTFIFLTYGLLFSFVIFFSKYILKEQLTNDSRRMEDIGKVDFFFYAVPNSIITSLILTILPGLLMGEELRARFTSEELVGFTINVLDDFLVLWIVVFIIHLLYLSKSNLSKVHDLEDTFR